MRKRQQEADGHNLVNFPQIPSTSGVPSRFCDNTNNEFIYDDLGTQMLIITLVFFLWPNLINFMFILNGSHLGFSDSIICG